MMKTQALQKLFQAFTEALQSNSESNFRALWHPESYTRNLVGGGGQSGDAVFTQAANSRWTLVPDLDDMEALEEPTAFLIPCAVKEFESGQGEVLDKVYALIGQDAITNNLWLLGAGEDYDEVLGLWERLSESEAAPSNHAKDMPEEIPDDISPILSTEEAALKTIEILNEALKKRDQQLFAEQWIFKGYRHNLVGASGLPGHEFFVQAANSQWRLKAQLEFASLFDNPEGILIPCSIWLNFTDSPKNPDDEHFILLVNANRKLCALGIGKDVTEMRHLYLSYKNEVMV